MNIIKALMVLAAAFVIAMIGYGIFTFLLSFLPKNVAEIFIIVFSVGIYLFAKKFRKK